MNKLITVSENLLTVKKPFIYIGELLKAREEAKKNKLGIWSL